MPCAHVVRCSAIEPQRRTQNPRFKGVAWKKDEWRLAEEMYEFCNSRVMEAFGLTLRGRICSGDVQGGPHFSERMINRQRPSFRAQPAQIEVYRLRTVLALGNDVRYVSGGCIRGVGDVWWCPDYRPFAKSVYAGEGRSLIHPGCIVWFLDYGVYLFTCTSDFGTGLDITGGG